MDEQKRQQWLNDFQQVQIYLTTKDPTNNCTKYTHIINKTLIALARDMGHLPPQFFQHTGFEKSAFFNGNAPVFSKIIDQNMAGASAVIMEYLQTPSNEVAKPNVVAAANWLYSAFGPALDILFHPKSKYLIGFHIQPTSIPGYTIFAAEREQLLPLLAQLVEDLQQ